MATRRSRSDKPRWCTHAVTESLAWHQDNHQTRDLEGIVLNRIDLSGWDFSSQNLARASFWGATLANADFSLADLRDGQGVDGLPAAITRNAILPSGLIDGLVLQANEGLVVRDGAVQIMVNKSISLSDSSSLELRFEDAIWDSSIHFSRDVTPNLGGTLTLSIAADADINTMVDIAFGVFDWNGDGVFDQQDIVAALQTGNYLRGRYA